MSQRFRKRSRRLPGSEDLFRRASHVVRANHAGTVVLFDGRRYFTLPNHVANLVWELLANDQSREALVDRIFDEFEAPRDRIQGDVAEMLHELRRYQLVEAVGPGHRTIRLPRWWQFWHGPVPAREVVPWSR